MKNKHIAVKFTCGDAKEYLDGNFCKRLYLFAREYELNSKNVVIDPREIISQLVSNCRGNVCIGYLLLHFENEKVETLFVDKNIYIKFFKEIYTVVE